MKGLTLKGLVIAVILLTVIPGAEASDGKNYIALFGSLSDMIDNSETDDPSYIDKKVKNKTGWGGSIEMGRGFGENLRFGLQYGFQRMQITNQVRTYKPSITNGNINIGMLDPNLYYPSSGGNIEPIAVWKEGFFKQPGLISVNESSNNMMGRLRENTPEEIFNRDAIGTMTTRVVDNGDGTYTFTRIFVGSYKITDKAGNTLETISWTEIRQRNTWRVDGVENEEAILKFSHQDNLQVQTLMPNIYWDWHFDSWSPYIGAGAGLAYINKGKDYNFAWQVMAGLGYFLTREWKATMGATYLDGGDVQFEEGVFNIRGSLETVQVNFGLTYWF